MSTDVPQEVFTSIKARLDDLFKTFPVMENGPGHRALHCSGLEIICAETGPVKVLHIIEDEDEDRPTVRIEDIILEESVRGQGIGTKIIRAVVEACEPYGVDINLSANPLADYNDPERQNQMDRLISWYERFGFQDKYGAGNMVLEASVRMEHPLSPG